MNTAPRSLNAPRALPAFLASLLAASLLLGGCSPQEGEEDIEVLINPPQATVAVGGVVVFTGVAKNAFDPGVRWSVPAGDTAGTISQAGVYTAPNTPGTYEVKATSFEDDTQSATAQVTVVPGTSVALTLSPDPLTLQTNARQTFTATVTGTSDPRVSWRVQEGPTGGTISAEGTYSAPGTPGTYHVIATSVADPRATQSVAVTVTSSFVPSVTLSPVHAAVVSGQFFAFDGAVYGVRYSTPLQWSVLEPGGGGFTSRGLYLAPLRTGTFHVAVSPQVDPSKRALGTVDVQQPTGVSVWIAPSSPTVPPQGKQSFAASVSGTADQRVTWSIREGAAGGTVTPDGVYTAPALGINVPSASYTLIATSVADPTRRAETPVLVTRLPVYSLALNPTQLKLRPGASSTFSAFVYGGGTYGGTVGYAPSLVWRVLEGGGGTITSGGVYTAPSAPGIYHVAAESEEVPDTFSTVTVE